MKNKICLALDVDNITSVRTLVSETRDFVGIYKVGLELFTALGPSVVEEILGYDCKVFLDLKYHDIPTTVKKAAIAATRMGVSILNVHALGGIDMMRETANAVDIEAKYLGIERPKVLAVTVLTSVDKHVLDNELLVQESLKSYVNHLAMLVKIAGLDGVVCSPLETAAIKSDLGSDFICLTPGIRPTWSVANDQKRFTTPIEALQAGSDYIVVGRPITKAFYPAKAAQQLLEEVEQHFAMG